MAGKSTLKKFLLLATFCRELLPKELSLHARYGAKKNLFPGLVEFGGVLVQIQKNREHMRTRSPSRPPVAPAHRTHPHPTQATPRHSVCSMALNLEVSNKAPALPIDLTDDLMDAFEIFSGCYGGLSLGQASMKALQCIPLAWACLAIKESSKMSKDARDREASRCYQEVALPGWIKVCNLAIEQSGGSLRFPAGWQTRLYYTTYGGACARIAVGVDWSR